MKSFSAYLEEPPKSATFVPTHSTTSKKTITRRYSEQSHWSEYGYSTKAVY